MTSQTEHGTKCCKRASWSCFL